MAPFAKTVESAGLTPLLQSVLPFAFRASAARQFRKTAVRVQLNCPQTRRPPGAMSRRFSPRRSARALLADGLVWQVGTDRTKRTAPRGRGACLSADRSDVGTWRNKWPAQRRALLGAGEHQACQKVAFLAAEEFCLLTRTFNGRPLYPFIRFGGTPASWVDDADHSEYP